MSALLTTLLLAAAPWSCAPVESPVRASVRLSDGRMVLARDGRLSVGTEDRTVCDGLPGAFPTAVATSPVDGTLYVGFRREGVFRLDARGFTALPALGADVAAGGVRALAVSGDGRVLAVGTGTHGLFTYLDEAEPRRVSHPVLGRQGVFAVRSTGAAGFDVALGPYGAFGIPGREGRAVRRSRGFVGCFDAAGGPAVFCPPGSVPEDSGALPSGHVSALAVSPDGATLFVGTFDAGVFTSPDGRRFAPLAGVAPFVNVLANAPDGLYIGTARGLFFRALGAADATPVPGLDTHVTALAVGPDGALAVGTNQGVRVLSNGLVQQLGEAAGLPGRQVWAVAYDAAGALWVGTADGLFRSGRAGEVAERFTQATGHLTHDWVTAISPESTGAVRIGTYDAGIVRLHAEAHAVRGWRAEMLTDSAWVNPGGLVPLGRDLLVLTLGGGAGPLGPDGVRSIVPAALDDVTAAVPFRGRLFVGTRGGLVSAPLDEYPVAHAFTEASHSPRGEPLRPHSPGLRLDRDR